MGYFKFFSLTGLFFRPVPYPIKKIKFLTKNHLNYYSFKVTKFHGDSVKNKSARRLALMHSHPNRLKLIKPEDILEKFISAKPRAALLMEERVVTLILFLKGRF